MNGIKNYSKKVFTLLRKQGFRMTTFIPSRNHTDFVGYLSSKEPFPIINKSIIRIQEHVSESSIDTFNNTIKAMDARSGLIFCKKYNKSLDKSAEKYGISIINETQLKKLLKQFKVASGKRTSKEFDDITRQLHPIILASHIPTFAKNKIPNELKTKIDEKLKGWQLLEDSVFISFREIFNFHSLQLGYKRLFDSEPDGYTIYLHESPPYAIIYDCKSTEDKYTISVEDRRAYVEYINQKKDEIKHSQNVDLKYILIIAPEFKGNLMKRFKEIADATNILPWYITADAFSKLVLEANKLQPTHRKLILFKNLFPVGEVCTNKNVTTEIKRVNKLINPGSGQ